MTQATTTTAKTIAENALMLYACGGAAASVSSMVESSRDINVVGLAPINAVYADVSKSDVKDLEISEEHLYLFPEAKDGSGGIRSANTKPIRAHAKEMLQKFKPTQTSVALFSASGGTGNVIGGVILNELLGDDVDPIVIVIGSTESDIHIRNTLSVLKMIEKLTINHNRAINMVYLENSKETPPSMVDEQVCYYLVSIATVFSRQNKSLDRADLRSVLNYDTVTKFKPHMSGLRVIEGEINSSTPGVDKIISVASIIKDLDNRGLDVRVPFARHGILPVNAPVEQISRLPFHLAVTAYPFNDIAERLNKELAEIDRANAARPESTGVLTKQEATGTDDDFLFAD